MSNNYRGVCRPIVTLPGDVSEIHVRVPAACVKLELTWHVIWIKQNNTRHNTESLHTNPGLWTPTHWTSGQWTSDFRHLDVRHGRRKADIGHLDSGHLHIIIFSRAHMTSVHVAITSSTILMWKTLPCWQHSHPQQHITNSIARLHAYNHYIWPAYVPLCESRPKWNPNCSDLGLIVT